MTVAETAVAIAPETGTGGLPVLVGFADALAAPEVAWSLLDAGRPVVAFARRGSRPALRRASGVRIVEISSPERDAARALDELRTLATAGRFAAVMPLDDAALWLCDQALRHLEIQVAGPTGQGARLALDKRLQLEAAAAAGLAVPPSRCIESVDELMALREFPLHLKPARPVEISGGRLARGANYICADPDELHTAAKSWAAAHPLIAQPLLTGTGEGLFGLAGPTGVQAWSAHRRVRMMNPQGSGSSACMTKAVDPELAHAAELMLGNAGWVGMFMLEFLRDDQGRPWFMELNGRPWGSMALARRSGLEYPAWAVQQIADPTLALPFQIVPEGQVCRHLGRELVHMLMVLRGPRSEASTDWPSRRRTLRQILQFSSRDGWYNARRGDRALFVEDTLRTVLSQLAGGARSWR